MVRVAMIGAGAMATKVHYPSLASFPDVEIAAVCDLDSSRRQSVAERFGIARQFTDYGEMLREVRPDAVYAIGPPHHMYDVWTECLQQGRSLFVEKPLGLSLHQARALTHLAERNGCITQVGFQRRSCPMVVQALEECRRRGPVVHAVCSFYKCAPEPLLGARDHMMDDGVHAIDTLRWICGGEVCDVHSVTRCVGTPDINFFTATLEFDNGATGVLLNSWTSGRRVFRVEIHSPGICAEAEHEGKARIYADGDTQGVELDTRECAGSDELHVYGGFRAKSREFIDCIRSGRQPSSCFADALETMKVAERILAQGLLREAGG